MKIIKQKQAEILQLKSTQSEIKNMIKGINRRVDQIEERISKLEDMLFENTQLEKTKNQQEWRKLMGNVNRFHSNGFQG